MGALVRSATLFSGLVPGIEIPDMMKEEPVLRSLIVCGDWLQEIADVVAERPSLEDPAHEPSSAVVENRYLSGSGAPAAARERVGLVSRLFPEQVGQFHGPGVEKMDAEDVGLRGGSLRPVLV